MGSGNESGRQRAPRLRNVLAIHKRTPKRVAGLVLAIASLWGAAVFGGLVSYVTAGEGEPPALTDPVAPAGSTGQPVAAASPTISAARARELLAEYQNRLQPGCGTTSEEERRHWEAVLLALRDHPAPFETLMKERLAPVMTPESIRNRDHIEKRKAELRLLLMIDEDAASRVVESFYGPVRAGATQARADWVQARQAFEQETENAFVSAALKQTLEEKLTNYGGYLMTEGELCAVLTPTASPVLLDRLIEDITEQPAEAGQQAAITPDLIQNFFVQEYLKATGRGNAGLIALLQRDAEQGNPWTRMNCLQVLNVVGDAKLLPWLRELGTRLKLEKDYWWQATMAHWGDPTVVAEIQRSRKAGEPTFTNSGTYYLAGSTDPAVHEILLGHLDPKAQEYPYVVLALAKFRDPKAFERIPECLRVYGQDRYDWFGALVEYGDGPAIDLLAGMANTGSFETRRKAVKALCRIEDARTVEPLLAALVDPYSRVRGAARGRLERIALGKVPNLNLSADQAERLQKAIPPPDPELAGSEAAAASRWIYDRFQFKRGEQIAMALSYGHGVYVVKVTEVGAKVVDTPANNVFAETSHIPLQVEKKATQWAARLPVPEKFSLTQWVTPDWGKAGSDEFPGWPWKGITPKVSDEYLIVYSPREFEKAATTPFYLTFNPVFVLDVTGGGEAHRLEVGRLNRFVLHFAKTPYNWETPPGDYFLTYPNNGFELGYLWGLTTNTAKADPTGLSPAEQRTKLKMMVSCIEIAHDVSALASLLHALEPEVASRPELYPAFAEAVVRAAQRYDEARATQGLMYLTLVSKREAGRVYLQSLPMAVRKGLAVRMETWPWKALDARPPTAEECAPLMAILKAAGPDKPTGGGR